MKPTRLLVAFSAFLLLAGLGVEYGVFAPRRAEIAKLVAESARLEVVALRQREDIARIQHELRDLEQSAQSARIAAAAAEAASVMKLWGRRIALLKRLFGEMPAQAIPELRLLDAKDWISIVRERELDSPEDIRAAFAAARAMSLKRMGRILIEAIQAFAAQNDGAIPREVAMLAAHLSPPADLEMLQRYRIIRSGKLADGEDPIIVELDPRDLILKVTPAGWQLGSNSDWKSLQAEPKSVWLARASRAINSAMQSEGIPEDVVVIPTRLVFGVQAMMTEIEPSMERILDQGIGEELKQAAKRYQAERGTLPTTMADLAHYVSRLDQIAPLARPLLARLDYMLDHEGHPPTDPAQLRRYLDRPFDQMNILRAMRLVIEDDSLTLSFSFSESKTTTEKGAP